MSYMRVRNRMADVIKLRCNACQDFFKMVVMDGWQEKLYEIARDAVENNRNHKAAYINVYEKMRDTGIKMYAVDDMDVTLIASVVSFTKGIVQVTDATKKELNLLRDDRNITNHSSENEEDKELYLNGIIALKDLKSFVDTVDRCERMISDSERLQYRQKYSEKIYELIKQLDDERIKLIQLNKQMDEDILILLNSEDILQAWVNINKQYMGRYMKTSHDYDTYYYFLEKASNAGIQYAHLGLALYYTILEDYQAAGKRISMALSTDLSNNSKKDIIDIFNTTITKNGQLPEEFSKIIKDIEIQGYNLEQDSKGYYSFL